MSNNTEYLLNYLPHLREILLRHPDWLERAVDTKQASQITGIPVTTLVSLRSKGGGPRYIRPAGTRICRYFRRHLYEWLLSGGLKNNTAQNPPAFLLKSVDIEEENNG